MQRTFRSRLRPAHDNNIDEVMQSEGAVVLFYWPVLHDTFAPSQMRGLAAKFPSFAFYLCPLGSKGASTAEIRNTLLDEFRPKLPPIPLVRCYYRGQQLWSHTLPDPNDGSYRHR